MKLPSLLPLLFVTSAPESPSGLRTRLHRPIPTSQGKGHPPNLQGLQSRLAFGSLSCSLFVFFFRSPAKFAGETSRDSH